MKKILLSLLAISAITTAAFAGNPAEKHIGYNYVTLGEETGHGVGFGADYMVPVFEAHGVKGLEMGLGVNFDVTALDTTVNSTTSSMIYGGDLEALVGYRYQDFNVRGGVGYDMTVVADSAYLHGVVFSASAGYEFTENWLFEVSYTVANDMSLESAGTSTGADIDKETVGFNLVWKN